MRRIPVIDKSSGSESVPLRLPIEFYRQFLHVEKPAAIMPAHIRLVRQAIRLMFKKRELASAPPDFMLIRCIENKDWEGLAWVLQHVEENIPIHDIHILE